MAIALLVVPLVFALVALAVPSPRVRPWLLPLAGGAHLAAATAAIRAESVSAMGGWLELDPASRIVLGLLSTLFFVCSFYIPGYLATEAHAHTRPPPSGSEPPPSSAPSWAGRDAADRANRQFCAVMLMFLAMMTLVVLSRHLGLMWVAVEATTLASAPLIFFHRDARSLEATWKYLLICSVGIALALLGSFFLAYSALRAGLHPTLLIDEAVRDAPLLSKPWLHSAFVLAFIGYGTKMGVAPMHTWLPDAHSEAPSPVSALLSGALLNCAFLAILRFYRIASVAGEGAFARETMVAAGVLSMAVAGVFMIRQKDYKRMLAYSSVEHMGILVLGVGTGGAGAFGAFLHLLNNGFAKGALFLSAGNIHRAFGSKSTDEVGGALQRLPQTGAIFLAGFFAITGAPPFGLFLSEFTILNAAVSGGRFLLAGAFLVLLVIVFVGMGSTVLAVVQGQPRQTESATDFREGLSSVAPAALLIAFVLLLGVYVPAPLVTFLHDAAASLEK
jgi:hydrogenase-4 component F